MTQLVSCYKTSVLKLRSDTSLTCDALKAQSTWHKYVQCWSVGWHTCHVHCCWCQHNPDMHAGMSYTNATLEVQQFLCVSLVRISTFRKPPCDFLRWTAVTSFPCRTSAYFYFRFSGIFPSHFKYHNPANCYLFPARDALNVWSGAVHFTCSYLRSYSTYSDDVLRLRPFLKVVQKLPILFSYPST
jgi:hypothetical protein